MEWCPSTCKFVYSILNKMFKACVYHFQQLPHFTSLFVNSSSLYLTNYYWSQLTNQDILLKAIFSLNSPALIFYSKHFPFPCFINSGFYFALFHNEFIVQLCHLFPWWTPDTRWLPNYTALLVRSKLVKNGFLEGEYNVLCESCRKKSPRTKELKNTCIFQCLRKQHHFCKIKWLHFQSTLSRSRDENWINVMCFSLSFLVINSAPYRLY